MKFEYGTEVFQFEAGGVYPAQRTHRVYQVQDKTAGGTIKVQNLGIKASTRTIIFDLMPKVDYDGLVNWFLNIVNAGEIDFTFTDEYGDSGLVKITDSIIDFAETSLERYAGSITLEYV
jgi:hypothetical protein